jgi:DNA-binding transcriptional regulator YhcF (GntR family)
VSRPALHLDANSPLPPFEQVRDQLGGLIATGGLAEGERLPTVRGLATELGLAAGTVARAYKELEAAGLVTTRSRAGTVVAPQAQSTEVALRTAARAFAACAVEADVDDMTAVDAVREALRSARREA